MTNAEDDDFLLGNSKYGTVCLSLAYPVVPFSKFEFEHVRFVGDSEPIRIVGE